MKKKHKLFLAVDHGPLAVQAGHKYCLWDLKPGTRVAK